MKIHYLLLLFIFFILFFTGSYAAGIRGTVTADDGNSLAYATIFVKQLGTGTTTNMEGYYEIVLSPGTYTLVYQYLGYQTEVREATVGSDFIEMNIALKTQVTVLQTVTVRAGKEDPAYTIMRKAIAKANYHRNQFDSYTARVYIKGTGKLKDYPWIAKKMLEKEGVEKDRVYITESVSEIKYTRPGKFDERVISIHSDGKDNNTSPNTYIFGSFYESQIGGTITPLSPKAFSYYHFEYQGTFKDREYEISKIKVTPRSRGDNVVEGVIYIVENWWSLHSLDITMTNQGIDVSIKVMYAPIEDKAWLPVSHRFDVLGRIFGFEFEYNYFATVSDYKLTLNPELYVENEQMEVVDEKLEKQHAKEVQEKYGKEATQLQERLEAGKEITRKELKNLINEYEKQEQKQQKNPSVLSDVTFKIDSGAYKKDSSYWQLVRPIPLTRAEIRGYEKIDSMAEVKRKKEAGDTIKQSKHKGFQPWDILTGDNYKISKHGNFKIEMPRVDFNTVEGYNLVYRLSIGTIIQDTNKTRFYVAPTFRYAFAREHLSGNLSINVRNKKYKLRVEGGSYVRQFNDDNPILPIVNTFTTLFLERNLMKIYERDYIDLFYQRKLSDFVSINTTWSLMTRQELHNNSNQKLINRSSIEGYTDNRPNSNELTDTSFPCHNAFIGSLGVSMRPWLKFRVRNGDKQPIESSSPSISLEYNKGFNDVFASTVDFDQLELGVRYGFQVGIRGKIDLALRGGAFVNNNNLYFMDYKHFLGNRTPFSTTDPIGSFRLLDYYQYSTADRYLIGNVHYQFRKFLVTTVPYVRLLGIRENIFVNYLATPTSLNYTELGYSIDGILRFFRLEVAAAFQDGKYIDYGFRIGIATTLSVKFSGDN